MLNFEEVSLNEIVVHKIGNKHNDEAIGISKKGVIVEEEVGSILLNYFLKPFVKEEFYNFTHEVGLEYNEMFTFATKYFENKDSFYDQSVNIAMLLYDKSNHPKIKSGEFYLVSFSGCVVDGEVCDALGIFKSENKDTFLKIFQKEENYGLSCDTGINIKKLDKGCIIYNTEKDQGYKISIVDATNKKNEALYWKEDFLNIKIREDSFYYTQTYMDMCKGFMSEVYNDENKVGKADQIDLLRRSLEFFKENKDFTEEKFKDNTIDESEVLEAFDEYKKFYQEDRGVVVAPDFKISGDAVKDEQRLFKQILKLDKNFHIYIHGQKKFIEKGFDTEKDLNYYKLYFKEEV